MKRNELPAKNCYRFKIYEHY